MGKNVNVYELILVGGEVVKMILEKGVSLKYVLAEKNLKVRGYKILKG